MYCVVDDQWFYRGYRCVVLENEMLRISVFPALGANVYSIFHKPTAYELLWRNPRISPAPAPFGASYADWWFGGWDEVFPNDGTVTFQGEPYPNHGELWCTPWQYTVLMNSDHSVSLDLHLTTRIVPAHVRKVVSLKPGSSCLTIAYTVQNTGNQPFVSLFKSHPSFAVSPESRVNVPCRQVLVDPWVRGSTRFRDDSYIWPYAPAQDGTTVDMRVVQPASACVAFSHYAVELDDGWASLTHPDKQLRLTLSFPLKTFPFLWLFGNYGGWRDGYCLNLEPATGYPHSFLEAIRLGTLTTLAPGETWRADITLAASMDPDQS